MRNHVVIAASLLWLTISAPAATVFSENWESDSPALTKTALVNWNVLGGTNVDVGTFNFGGCVGRCLDIDGTGGLSNADIESKSTFTFVAGTEYTLMFTLGVNTDFPSVGNTVRVRIGTLVDQTFNAPSANPGFATSLSFTPAVNQVATLRMTAGGPADNAGGALDNIVLSSGSLPEPSTIALITFGLGSLVLLRRFHV